MELLNVFQQDKACLRSQGFTLVEILVVAAILIVILGLGLFIGFDFYKSYSSRSEEGIIVSVLQKARNLSLNNINQTKHGVHFEENPLRYIIFEEGNPSADIIIQASYGVSISPLPPDIIFDQLSGSCTNCPISVMVNDGANNHQILINEEGGISWQKTYNP